MNKIIYLILFLLTACQPLGELDDDVMEVSKSQWANMDTTKPYPFTVDYGQISCSLNEVEFYPYDTAYDESQVGLPLNRLAQIRAARADLKPTVEYSIKPNADLSEAIQMGLEHCKKVNAQLAKFNS